MKTFTLKTTVFLLICCFSIASFGQNLTNEDVLEQHGIFVNKDMDDNTEELDHKIKYLMNSSNELIQLVDSIISYSYANSYDSVLSTMIVNEFNDLNQIACITNYNYVQETSTWQYSTRFLKEYDANGNMILSLIQDWSEDETTWINSRKLIYEFDENDNRTLRQLWDVGY